VKNRIDGYKIDENNNGWESGTGGWESDIDEDEDGGEWESEAKRDENGSESETDRKKPESDIGENKNDSEGETDKKGPESDTDENEEGLESDVNEDEGRLGGEIDEYEYESEVDEHHWTNQPTQTNQNQLNPTDQSNSELPYRPLACNWDIVERSGALQYENDYGKVLKVRLKKEVQEEAKRGWREREEEGKKQREREESLNPAPPWACIIC